MYLESFKNFYKMYNVATIYKSLVSTLKVISYRHTLLNSKDKLSGIPEYWTITNVLLIKKHFPSEDQTRQKQSNINNFPLKKYLL
jgi:hypothetical protein